MRDRLAFNHGAAVALPQPAPAVRLGGERPGVRWPVVRPVRPTLAYWGAWAFTALLFIRPQDTLTMLEPLHLSEVIAVGSLAALFAGRLSSGLPLLRLTPELGGVLGLAVVMLATVPFSIWPGGALNAFLEVYLKVALIFILLTHGVRSLEMLRALTWLLVVTVGYAALRGVIDYVLGINVRDGRLWGAAAGLMGNPNDFAMNMVTFVPFALVVAFGREPLGRRVIAAIAAAAMLAVIVFTKSRAGMLGLAVMMGVLLVLAGRLRGRLLVAVLLGSLIAVPTLPPSVWARLSSIVNQDEGDRGSREARKQLMREGWQTFLDHPVTGVGVAQFRNYKPPGRSEMWHETHNVLLQVLAELGLAGGLLFLYLMGCTVSALVRTRRLLRRDRAGGQPASAGTAIAAFSTSETDQLRRHLAAATAGFAGWFTCAQFASIGYYWTYYYLLALVVIARDLASDRVRVARRAAASSGALA